MYEFDGDTWSYNALMDYVAFKELHEFVNNKLATEAHSASYELIGDAETFSEAQLAKIKNFKINTLMSALSHFGSQTIISLCTTFEVSVREYLRAALLAKPAAMFEFIGSEESRGQIPLKEILHVSSHEDLLARLADKASGAASKGKYGQVYSRALSCSGCSEDRSLAEKLNSLQAERNKMVHERHRPKVEMAEVSHVHELVGQAIDGLCKAGFEAGVPGRYTCVKPEIRFLAESVVMNVRKDA